MMKYIVSFMSAEGVSFTPRVSDLLIETDEGFSKATELARFWFKSKYNELYENSSFQPKLIILTNEAFQGKVFDNTPFV